MKCGCVFREILFFMMFGEGDLWDVKFIELFKKVFCFFFVFIELLCVLFILDFGNMS